MDDVGELRQAEYCILELSEDTLEEHGDIEDEYLSLEHNDRDDLENLLTLPQQFGYLPPHSKPNTSQQRTMTEPELRDKEQIIPQRIQSGNDDVRKITETTTLENHQLIYAFQKLEDLWLVEVSKPDDTVKRIIEEQKRVFHIPNNGTHRQSRTTPRTSGEQKLDEYENLSHRELVEKSISQSRS